MLDLNEGPAMCASCLIESFDTEREFFSNGTATFCEPCLEDRIVKMVKLKDVIQALGEVDDNHPKETEMESVGATLDAVEKKVMSLETITIEAQVD